MSDLFKVAVALIVVGVGLLILGLVFWGFEERNRCKCKACAKPPLSRKPVLIGGLGVLLLLIGVVLFFVDKSRQDGRSCNHPLVKQYDGVASDSIVMGANGTIINTKVLTPVRWADNSGQFFGVAAN